MLYVLGTSLVIFTLSIGYISYKSLNVVYKKSVVHARNIARASALEAEKEPNMIMDVVRTLSQAYTTYSTLPQEQWKDLFIEMYARVFENNPQFYKLWDSWELKALDPDYDKDYGRFVITFFRKGNKIDYYTTTRSLDGDPPLYSYIKSQATELILEPYWDEYNEDVGEKMFVTSLIAPIKIDGKYAGIVAADVTLDRVQEMIRNIKPFAGSYAFMLSNKGVFVSYPNREFVGKTIAEEMPEIDQKYSITDRIKAGERFDMTIEDPLSGKKSLMLFNKIQFGDTKTPWSVAIVVPIDVIMSEAINSLLVSIIVGLVGLALMVIVIYNISRSISKPMQLTTEMLRKMSHGEIDSIDILNLNRSDEIGQMAESLNKLIEGLDRTAKFAIEIGKGNLEQEYHLLGENDVLGNALLDMRRSLKIAEEDEEKRKQEDEKQRWTTEGVAKFGEIIRNNNSDLKQLSFRLMSGLVNYLDANQGALFVINDDDKNEVYLEMTSAIAYNREKYVKKRVKIGEDLVGRCAHERMTIYMTDLPEDYIEITSGMGTANPRCLVLVPVLLNDQVFGIIEIASFNKFEEYQIEFIEKIGQSIASTISSVRINERTQKLLQQSQEQREELSSQEEEMRQTIEELQAIQEETARKEVEMRGLVKALNSSTYTVEYDLNGRVIAVNEAVLRLIGVTKEQIIGTNHKDGTDFAKLDAYDYQNFWSDLVNGIPKKKESYLFYNGREVYLSETYMPIVDDSNNVYKILKIGFDITELKKQSLELDNLKNQVETLTAHIEEQNAQIEAYGQSIEISQKIDSHQETQLEEESIKETSNKQDNKPTSKGKLEPIVPQGEPLVEKSDRLLTGIEEIDEQHNRIIDLINQLYEAFINNQSKKEIKEILKNIADFSAYHFSTEERYFKQFGYENSAEHIQSHKRFLDKINNFRKDYQEGKSINIQDMMLYLQSWTANHFGEYDQDFIQLFNDNGL